MNKTDELLDALADMVNQHCRVVIGKAFWDSMALSANAHAMRVLAKHGRFSIEREVGKRIIGELKYE